VRRTDVYYNKYLKDLKYPVNKVRVCVGLEGSHYHLCGCPSTMHTVYLGHPEDYDYMEIEIPVALADQRADIEYLGKRYRSHIDICADLMAKSYGLVLEENGAVRKRKKGVSGWKL
jgi:hypothetical protein